MQHLFGERDGLRIRHAAQEDGHQQSRYLIISHVAGRIALNDESNLVARQRLAVTLLFNNVNRSHEFCSPVPCQFRLEIKTTACAAIASPRPMASSPSFVFALTLT